MVRIYGVQIFGVKMVKCAHVVSNVALASNKPVYQLRISNQNKDLAILWLMDSVQA